MAGVQHSRCQEGGAGYGTPPALAEHMTEANPVQITFRKLPHDDELAQEAEALVEQLQQLSQRLHGVEVVLEPRQRRHQGGGNHVRVGIRLHLPGRTITVGRHPARPGHSDARLALHDAFRAARRQLREAERRYRHQVKDHFDPAERGRVQVLEEEHGFLESYEGRELYFHPRSVVNADFAMLHVGDEVRFSEGRGDQGPQASSVWLLGSDRGGSSVP